MAWKSVGFQLCDVFTKPLIKAQFCYFREDSPYWIVQVRDESRFRSTYGMDVPYQCVIHQQLLPKSSANDWVMLFKSWAVFRLPGALSSSFCCVSRMFGPRCIMIPTMIGGLWITQIF